MMAEILKLMVQILAKIHNGIIRYCNVVFGGVSDKMLHFVVIGAVGMAMVAVIYPVFKALAKKKLIMAITWIYVFTMIIVLTFSIEIGQKITNTGNMEFADIAAGLLGFLSMFAVMLVIWGIVALIKKLVSARSDY